MRATGAEKQAIQALAKLLDAREPKYWKQELTEMFSGWIGSHYTDGMTASQRMGVYTCYTDLCEMFDELAALEL